MCNTDNTWMGSKKECISTSKPIDKRKPFHPVYSYKFTQKPVIGRWYSSYKNTEDNRNATYMGEPIIKPLQLIAEDDEFYYFKNDKVRLRKSQGFSWHRWEPPQDTPILTEADMKKPYHSYSLWSQQLAQTETVQELKKVVHLCEFEQVKNRNSVMRIINKNSNAHQARAQIKNASQANYEKIAAYKSAIEIHKNYPEFSKAKQ